MPGQSHLEKQEHTRVLPCKGQTGVSAHNRLHKISYVIVLAPVQDASPYNRWLRPRRHDV